MKEFKGTPGPWLRHGTAIYVRGGGFDVRCMPEAEENAKLLAASPELLSSLQHLVEVYDSEDGKQWTTTSKKAAIAEARAAIDKALGE